MSIAMSLLRIKSSIHPWSWEARGQVYDVSFCKTGLKAANDQSDTGYHLCVQKQHASAETCLTQTPENFSHRVWKFNGGFLAAGYTVLATASNFDAHLNIGPQFTAAEC
jgi:hypothetical protein